MDFTRENKPSREGKGPESIGSAVRAFYQRLYQTEKTKKLALTTYMRKLLSILNEMMKHQCPRRLAVGNAA